MIFLLLDKIFNMCDPSITYVKYFVQSNNLSSIRWNFFSSFKTLHLFVQFDDVIVECSSCRTEGYPPLIALSLSLTDSSHDVKSLEGCTVNGLK